MNIEPKFFHTRAMLETHRQAFSKPNSSLINKQPACNEGDTIIVCFYIVDVDVRVRLSGTTGSRRMM